VPEAPLDDSGSGLAPTGPGWFVVNVGDAMWLTTEGGEKKRSGSECSFETPMAEFEQLGVRIHVLPPGEPNGCYHAENQQEDFLVLSGECTLLVDGEERTLRAWDFFHAPAGTEHIFVGAGDEPCAILMVGARMGDWTVRYPVSELAARHGASVERETSERTRRTPSGSSRGASVPPPGIASPGRSPSDRQRTIPLCTTASSSRSGPRRPFSSTPAG
jgi:uncharacterized cupin superfamily protein